jgi:hypothetical protein
MFCSAKPQATRRNNACRYRHFGKSDGTSLNTSQIAASQTTNSTMMTAQMMILPTIRLDPAGVVPTFGPIGI